MSGGAGVAIFIAIIVVITIGWLLLSRAVDTGLDALVRNIFFRRSHKTGDYLIKNPLVFTTRANLDVLKNRVFNEIIPPDRNASWLPSLYLAEAGTNQDGEYIATFRRDSKLSEGLEIEVKLRPDAAGVVGCVDVMRWRVDNGVIQGVNDMKMIRQRVEEIVLSLDPHAQLSHPSQAVAPQQPQQWAPHPPAPPARPGPPHGYPAQNPSAAPAPAQRPSYPSPYPNPRQPVAPLPPPPAQMAPPVPQQGSRYPVPDTRTWTDRSQR